MPRPKSVLALTALCAFAAASLACGGAPKDPAERVAQLRSGYSAELNGFVVDQTPLVVEELAAPDAAAGVAEAAAAPEAGPEAGLTLAEPVPVRQDAILDILVSRRSHEALPGLTVDVEQIDGQGNAKRTWRVYLDTSDVLRGPGVQVSHLIEDVDYEQGDGFFVEVRHPIPAGERADYREFQEPVEGAR